MKKNNKLVGVVGLLSVAAVALAAKCIMLYKDNQNLMDLMEDDDDEDDIFDDEDDIFEDEDTKVTVKKDTETTVKEDDTDNPKIGENLVADEEDNMSDKKSVGK